MSDIFVAKSQSAEARVGPLHTITFVTSSEASIKTLLCDGMEMSSSDWYVPPIDKKAELDAYFGFSESDNWKVCSFFRTDDGANIQVRVIVIEAETPRIRPKAEGAFLGGLSIGFPLRNSDAREEKLRALGFPSVVGVKKMEFCSPEGEKYVSEEVHFVGPENLYALAVKRPDAFVPVGPLSEKADIGAPAYSAQCVKDCDAAIAFYRDVLGYEIRRDMTMKVGEKSGLKLRKGSDERFVQAFAPGSSSGYLVFLDHHQDRKLGDKLDNFGPPHRGLTMWSFPCKDIVDIDARAQCAGVKVLKPIAKNFSPFLPDSTSILLEDPNGFPIEIFQSAGM